MCAGRGGREEYRKMWFRRSFSFSSNLRKRNFVIFYNFLQHGRLKNVAAEYTKNTDGERFFGFYFFGATRCSTGHTIHNTHAHGLHVDGLQCSNCARPGVLGPHRTRDVRTTRARLAYVCHVRVSSSDAAIIIIIWFVHYDTLRVSRYTRFVLTIWSTGHQGPMRVRARSFRSDDGHRLVCRRPSSAVGRRRPAQIRRQTFPNGFTVADDIIRHVIFFFFVVLSTTREQIVWPTKRIRSV